MFNNFTPAPEMRAYLNVGFPFDVLTGSYVPGEHDVDILNGGMQHFTGISGGGNLFKSTLSHCLHMIMLSNYPVMDGMVYDTEPPSCSYLRFRQMMATLDKNFDLDTLEGRMLLTDITAMVGNEWFSKFREACAEKLKDKKDVLETPMKLRDGSFLKTPKPNCVEVDSLSMLTLELSQKIFDENEIGDGGANTEALRSQGAKTQMLIQMPHLTTSTNTFVIMTAHSGRTYDLDPRKPTPKQLQFQQQSSKLKNVPEKFSFLTNNLWHAKGGSVLKNQTTKAPEYPRNSKDDVAGDTDLMLITFCNLRAKNGPSGAEIELIISQGEGYRPDLTALNYLKLNKGYGMGGHNQSYFLEIYPDAKLSRTTVRRKCDEDARLRRALHFTGEMCQFKNIWFGKDRELLCEPAELYTDLIAKGYDWDKILDSRYFWAYRGTHTDTHLLTTKALLRLRRGDLVLEHFKKAPAEQSKAPAKKAA